MQSPNQKNTGIDELVIKMFVQGNALQAAMVHCRTWRAGGDGSLSDLQCRRRWVTVGPAVQAAMVHCRTCSAIKRQLES